MGVYLNNNGNLLPVAGRGNINGVYRANGILGAKNLLKVPYHHNTGVEFPVGGEVTNVGITYTHNADHSIKANGTATGGSYCIFNRKQDWSEFDLYGKEVTLSVSPVSNSVFLQLYDTDNSRMVCRTDSSTGEVTFTFPAELKNNTSWNISINFPTGAEPNNTTYYSMLRLASDTDDTYQPYAKTNKELTDMMSVQNLSDILFNVGDMSDATIAEDANSLPCGFIRTSDYRTANMPTIGTSSAPVWYDILTVRSSSDSSTVSYHHGFQIAVRTSAATGLIYIRSFNGNNTYGSWHQITMS